MSLKSHVPNEKSGPGHVKDQIKSAHVYLRAEPLAVMGLVYIETYMTSDYVAVKKR